MYGLILVMQLRGVQYAINIGWGLPCSVMFRTRKALYPGELLGFCGWQLAGPCLNT